MQRLEVSGAVRPIYGSLGVNRKGIWCGNMEWIQRVQARVEWQALVPPQAGIFNQLRN